MSTWSTASKRPMKSSHSWISLTTGFATVTGGGAEDGPPWAKTWKVTSAKPRAATALTLAVRNVRPPSGAEFIVSLHDGERDRAGVPLSAPYQGHLGLRRPAI